MRKAIVCFLLVVTMHSLSARESPLAMGFQAGFATTGSTVDMNLDLMSVNFAFNVPLGYSQIAPIFDVDPQAGSYWFYTISTDVTIAIPFSENLLLKFGLGAIALTDFGPSIVGVLGPVIKAEYWIWESNTAMVFTALFPTSRFELTSHEHGPTTRRIYKVPGLAQEWLFTSSIGLLYGY